MGGNVESGRGGDASRVTLLLSCWDVFVCILLGVIITLFAAYLSSSNGALPERKIPAADAPQSDGFTLVELSIVLVIIGLVVGGVVVGQSLIGAAAVRAQISQIEKYNTAVNTFRGKYGELPGDMDYTTASRSGFAAGALAYTRGDVLGLGDGNGLIEGTRDTNNYSANSGYSVGAGEPVMFWSDLTYANGMNINLIQGSFNATNPPNGGWACGYGLPCGDGGAVSGAQLAQAFPQAAIGSGNYVYAYSNNGINYYGLSIISALNYWQATTASGLTVAQAAAVDKKVDDSLPQSGNVTAYYVNGNGYQWAASGSSVGISPGNAASPSSTTCYDNGGNASNPMTYSLSQNGGAGINCAVSFRFE